MTATNVNPTVLQDGLTAVAGGKTYYASVHSADTGTSGANEIAGSTRTAVTFPAGSGGSATAPVVSVPTPAGATVKYWGLFTSGGSFVMGGKLPVDLPFPAAGKAELTITVAVKAATA